MSKKETVVKYIGTDTMGTSSHYGRTVIRMLVKFGADGNVHHIRPRSLVARVRLPIRRAKMSASLSGGQLKGETPTCGVLVPSSPRGNTMCCLRA